MVVEDDSSVAQMLRDVLEAEGFDVLVESDGEWAIRTFKSKSPQFVIMDVLVPKVQGFDLITRLRKLEGGKAAHSLALNVTRPSRIGKHCSMDSRKPRRQKSS